MAEQISPELKQLIRDTASNDLTVRREAMAFIAKAIEEPLRQAIFSGDITDNIFEVVQALPGDTTFEMELDPIAPGTEDDWAAFTIPTHGYIPNRHLEGDYVQIPLFEIGNAADWDLRLARKARMDIVARATEAVMSGFVKKINDDAWNTLIAAGYDRNIVVSDTDKVAAGQFTKRLVVLMKVVMVRNGGGNSNSMNRSRLTDLYMSEEAMADIATWNVDQIDEITRREIFTSEDGRLSRIFGVNLHPMTELGEGQEYQLYYTSTLGGSMPGSDVEIVVGLDRTRNDSFIMPVDEQVQVFTDDNMHRHRGAGIYGWSSQGFGVMNSGRVLLGSL